MDIKNTIVVSIAILVGMTLLLGTVLLAQNDKRKKIDVCIQKTGDELECKCAYRDCMDLDKAILAIKRVSELNK